MAPRRMLPWPVLIPPGVLTLFTLVQIIVAAAGTRLTPWPGVLVFSIFMTVVLLAPIVLIAMGIELTRARTLMAVACISLGAGLILAFGFHLALAGLVVGGLMLAAGALYTIQGHARIRAERAKGIEPS